MGSKCLWQPPGVCSVHLCVQGLPLTESLEAAAQGPGGGRSWRTAGPVPPWVAWGGAPTPREGSGEGWALETVSPGREPGLRSPQKLGGVKEGA